MMKINTLYATLFCICFVICSQTFSQSITQRGPNHSEIPTLLLVPQNDSLSTMREHIVLQLANEQINNDHLFFKAYLLTGPLQNRYSNSHVLHIELKDIEGNILKKQLHKINNGMVMGNLELPKRTKAGNYTVTAYTQWMKNFSDTAFTQKQIRVGNPSNIDISSTNTMTILPEGGILLQNYKNKIAFQIPPQFVSNDGYIGTIVDQYGNSIIKVQEYTSGAGIAFLKPENDKDYFLTLENGNSFPLPKSQDQGYLIQVNNIDALIANIQVSRSEKAEKTALKLVGTLRGVPYFEKKITFKNNSADIKLDKEKIPRGLLELQLLDEKGTQIIKRPIWIDGVSLQITMDQIATTADEMVYKVKVTDQTNKPVQTQVALSVIQKEKKSSPLHTNTVFESTDLFSSLTHQLNTTTTDRNRRFLQDMYVLFSQENDQYKTITNTIENLHYPIQKGLEIKGYAYDLNNRLLDNTTIQVMFTNGKDVKIEETTTDSEGILQLKNLHIDGETKLVFRTQGEDTKSRLVTLERILDYDQKSTDTKDKRISKIREKAKKAIKKSEQELSINPFDTTGTLILNDVAINGKKSKAVEMPSAYGIKPPKHRIMYQDIDRPKELEQLLQEMPGIMVNRANPFSPTLSILGAAGPTLIVLDGIPLSQSNTVGGTLTGSSSTPLNTLLDLVNDTDIQRIELLLGPDAAIYGSRAAGGVVSVYTRFALGETISRKKAQLDFQGYEPIISFDDYQNTLSKKEQKNANVLYWNPAIETNEQGEAIIRLPITTKAVSLEAKATTINQDGSVGVLYTSLN